MATSTGQQVSFLNYVLVDDEEQIAHVVSKVQKQDNIAVDCEGTELSRSGALTVLSIAVEEQAFIIDIKKLGEKAFQLGLKHILENDHQNKLLFDCRSDSDALWHQFQVKLNGVLDIQLMEILYREEKAEFDIGNVESKLAEAARHGVPHEKAIDLHSLKKVIETYLDSKELLSAKSLIKMSDRDVKKDIWDHRPLEGTLLQYASADVLSLLQLFEKFKSEINGNAMSRLKTASAIYTGFYREKFSRTRDKYEGNAYLPMEIIPKRDQEEDSAVDVIDINFLGTKQCYGCKRVFPASFFSLTQGKKRIRYCPICKKIKWNMDVEQNRCYNVSRNYYDSDEFYYYTDGSDE